MRKVMTIQEAIEVAIVELQSIPTPLDADDIADVNNAIDAALEALLAVYEGK